MSSDPISVKTVEPMIVAAVRRQVTLETLMPEAMKSPVWALTQQRGIRSPGHMVFIYHDRGREMHLLRPGGVAADLGVLVDEPFESDATLQCLRTPSGRVAFSRHHGHYELLPTIHGDIRAWCVAEGLEIEGLNWEYYGHWHEEPEQRITDVFYLLK